MKKSHLLLITCFVLLTFVVAFIPTTALAKAEFVTTKVYYIDGGSKLKVEGTLYNGANKTIAKIDEMQLTIHLFKSGYLAKSYKATLNNIDKKIEPNDSINHSITIDVDSAVQFDNYDVKAWTKCTYAK